MVIFCHSCFSLPVGETAKQHFPLSLLFKRICCSLKIFSVGLFQINYSQLLHTFILLAKVISVCNLLFSRLVLGLATVDQLVLYQNKGKFQFLPQTTSTSSMDTLSELSPKERVNWCSDPDTPNGPHRGQNVGALIKNPSSSIPFYFLALAAMLVN